MSYKDALIMIPAGFYKHYKGTVYQVLGIARNDETNEPLVIYCVPNTGEFLARPAKSWYDTVNGQKRFTGVSV